MARAEQRYTAADDEAPRHTAAEEAAGIPAVNTFAEGPIRERQTQALLRTQVGRAQHDIYVNTAASDVAPPSVSRSSSSGAGGNPPKSPPMAKPKHITEY